MELVEENEGNAILLPSLSSTTKTLLFVVAGVIAMTGCIYIYKRRKPQRMIKEYNKNPRKKKPRKYYRILKKRSKKKFINRDK